MLPKIKGLKDQTVNTSKVIIDKFLTTPSELTIMVPRTPVWLTRRFRVSSTSLDIIQNLILFDKNSLKWNYLRFRNVK